MSRPKIGITGPDSGGLAAWWFGALGVLRAGGWPIHITPERPYDGPLDGIIIGGGADVSPLLYSEEAEDDDELSELPVQLEEAGEDFGERAASVAVGLVRRLLSRLSSDGPMDADRDALETTWIERALGEELPIIGICRGMQLLNVVCGGDLIQDVRPLYTEHAYVRSVFPRKRVQVQPGSLLARTLCRERCRVNALHRQAVGRLGAGLQAVAWEPSGVVQAIERPEAPFVLGLQWHPELLPQLPTQRRIFRGLVRAARRRASRDAWVGARRLGQGALRSPSLGD